MECNDSPSVEILNFVTSVALFIISSVLIPPLLKRADTLEESDYDGSIQHIMIIVVFIIMYMKYGIWTVFK